MDITTLPNRKVESWKYTDLTRLLAGQNFEQTTHLHEPLDDQGLSITNFTKDEAKKFTDTAHFFEREIDSKRHPMAEHILKSDCPVNFIKISGVLSRPFELNFSLNANNAWWNCLTLIHIEAGCEAEIEYITDTADSNLINQLMLIKVDDNAKLTINTRRGKQPGTKHLQNMQIWQQRDSKVDLFYANDGEALGRYDAHAYLAGSGAEFRAAGYYKLNNKEHVDHHVLVEHLADHTASKQFFKGIMDGKSHGVFNGAAKVHTGVKHADANQHNYNLLLSKFAAIDTKPELEVYTDVVTAAHGAAIGRLDQEALFYLQSRGIDLKTARQMLIDAFFADVLNFL